MNRSLLALGAVLSALANKSLLICDCDCDDGSCGYTLSLVLEGGSRGGGGGAMNDGIQPPWMLATRCPWWHWWPFVSILLLQSCGIIVVFRRFWGHLLQGGGDFIDFWRLWGPLLQGSCDFIDFWRLRSLLLFHHACPWVGNGRDGLGHLHVRCNFIMDWFRRRQSLR